MKSFGIWYKIQEVSGKSANNNQESPKDLSVDFHINLWNIEKKNDKDIEPFIDFGIVIKDFGSTINFVVH